jgi:hypothetical protein
MDTKNMMIEYPPSPRGVPLGYLPILESVFDHYFIGETAGQKYFPDFFKKFEMLITGV